MDDKIPQKVPFQTDLISQFMKVQEDLIEKILRVKLEEVGRLDILKIHGDKEIPSPVRFDQIIFESRWSQDRKQELREYYYNNGTLKGKRLVTILTTLDEIKTAIKVEEIKV